MPRRKTPKVCVDRVLEGQQLEQARAAAWRERYQNQPLRPGISPTLLASLPEPFAMAVVTQRLWQPGRTLRVRFLDGEQVLRTKVEGHVHTWEQYAWIKFVFGDDPQAEIRISFSADPGSWSYLGTDALVIPQDQPTVNFGWLHPNTANDEVKRVVLHEFGHTLGCLHEHQSPASDVPWNRPAVYRYYAGPPNFWSPVKVDDNVLNKYSATLTQFSQFDPLSIMVYPISKEFTDGVFEVKLNNDLSETDKTFIATVYPQQIKPGVELTVGAAPLQASISQPGEEDLYRFTIPAGGAYSIQTSGSTDVMIGLFGPNDPSLSLATDDDSGPGLNARLEKVLQPGEYYVRVRHYHQTGSGEYGIRVWKSGSL